VLDAEGLWLAATGSQRQRTYAEATKTRGRLIMISALTLAEVLRGTDSDARVFRFLHGVERIPVDDAVARKASQLLAAAPKRAKDKSRTVDAIVCATAILHAPRPCAIVTSDPDDIRDLLGSERGIGPARP
jgi:predicted nucleic acid-binding protein